LRTLSRRSKVNLAAYSPAIRSYLLYIRRKYRGGRTSLRSGRWDFSRVPDV
jgi:hypothetical protein